ncbi:TPA: type IV secretion system DNA-binding domain-containing protein [Escherichia coli]|uniref:Mobilisation protein n=2 Tax=Enterobacterales TaxID=91347 RepID=B2G2N9_PRORE|nr:type IV secretion system DNA-binding domain-containing protein [Providencia rettgeri]CAQ48353.1 mobilisation protein [Providencia rettgeri]HAZ7996816.1 type IV secretion system DNA-binding domain-containing protein [Escherichia coli]HAZ7997400.1 type IV secretion system DNA-binding domain-containing protein [Escherichia coli]
MHPDDQRKVSAGIVIVLPLIFWITAVQKTEVLGSPKLLALWELMKLTPQKPILLLSALGGLAVGVLFVWLLNSVGQGEFGGAPFKRFLRGTRIVSGGKLKRMTREKAKQVTVAGVPMPRDAEPRHLLVNGATGTGKSVLLRELAYTGLLRGDRMVIVDPNGDMLSKFGRDKDVILNPYDKRTKGWSFFNEIRNDYDWQRYALSVVPRGKTDEAEEWASYGRLLLRETAKKLALIGTPSMRELFHWTTIATFDDLRGFLEGTLAESLFAGSNEASKALTSARFVLSDKLPEHVTMPDGDFSIRSWLEDPNGGNLFITWREDMGPALRPLISAWVDVVCTSILSLPEEPKRRLWLFIDELASLEKLASLADALTKGRKAGLRVVAGLQSTSQLDDVYGVKEAQTLRASFRSLVVLGGSRTDPKTNEDMSLSLGEHEVERDRYSKNTGKHHSTGRALERVRERVVMPVEIANLPDLTAYVGFAGNRPIAKVPLEIKQFANRQPAFVEGTI